MLSERFDSALLYAVQIHGGQKRKETDIPYVSHLLAVCSLTLEHGGDEDQAIAALLHDAAEDQGGEQRLNDIRTRFGSAVADIVHDCTDAWTDPKPPWRGRKEAYLAKLPGKSSYSLLVSLADKTHNARAIVMDARVAGPVFWSRFNAPRDEQLWYYRSLADVYQTALPGALADEFARTVEAMESL